MEGTSLSRSVGRREEGERGEKYNNSEWVERQIVRYGETDRQRKTQPQERDTHTEREIEREEMEWRPREGRSEMEEEM